MSTKSTSQKLLDDAGHAALAAVPAAPFGALMGHLLPLAAAVPVGAVVGGGLGFGLLYARERFQMWRKDDDSMGASRWRDVLGGMVGGFVFGALGGVLGGVFW